LQKTHFYGHLTCLSEIFHAQASALWLIDCLKAFNHNDKMIFCVIQSATQLTSTLTEAVATMAASVELKEPDLALLESLDIEPASLGRAAADDSLVAHVVEVLTSWSASMDEALTQQHAQHEVSRVLDCMLLGGLQSKMYY
jgi:hypothetical protein